MPEIDYATIDADSFGRSLSGIGVNLLVTDVRRSSEFLTAIFGFEAPRLSDDFAILTHSQSVLQLHADHTYSENPVLSLVPEASARGGGLEIRLYDCDPDVAEANAKRRGDVVLKSTEDRPHGLREVFILDADGYCWVASRAKDETPNV